MAKLFTRKQDTDTAENVQAAYANTRHAARGLFSHAKDTAQSTAANVKDTAQNTFTSAKGTTQDKLANTKDFVQSTLGTTRKATQDILAKVQDSAKIGLHKVQDLLATAVGIIITLLYENQRNAQKKAQQTQEKLKKAQVSLLQTAVPIVEKTQDAIATSTRNASTSLQKAAHNARDASEALQDWYVHYQRRRRRNRTLFRIGLLTGIALALLYAPTAGSELRKRIAQQWQHYSPHLEPLTNSRRDNTVHVR